MEVSVSRASWREFDSWSFSQQHHTRMGKQPETKQNLSKAHIFLSCLEIHPCISHSIKRNISFFVIENPTVNSAAPSETTKLFCGYSSRIKTSAKRSYLSHFLLNTQNIPFPQAKPCLLNMRIKHVRFFSLQEQKFTPAITAAINIWAFFCCHKHSFEASFCQSRCSKVFSVTGFASRAPGKDVPPPLPDVT